MNKITCFYALWMAALLWAVDPLAAQTKAAKRADVLYKASHFAEAAKWYEEALSQKASLGIMMRLANCYRMTNRYEEAAQLYAQIVQHKRARPESWLYYAETLMYQARYEEALKWVSQYQQIAPDDARAKLLERACLAAPHIKPLYPNMSVRPFLWNSPADEFSPVFFDHGLVFTSDRSQGLRLLKEKSGWTGREYLQLWYAQRIDDTTFTEPRLYDTRLNELNRHCGMASFTADGSEAFFTRNSHIAARNGAYHMQLYRAVRVGGKWKQAECLPFCSPQYNYMHPAVTADGQRLFFVSDKGGGVGGTDIWMVQRTEKGWSRPINLRSVNTPAHEAFPFVDAHGRLFFCSKGHPGLGGFDVFVSQRDIQGTWSLPKNLGPPVNSPFDDITFFLSADGVQGAFASSRYGNDDIFLFKISSAPTSQASHPAEKDVKQTP